MNKPGAGRPKKVLDERQIRELAALGCSMVEIGIVMGAHADTIRDNYSAAMSEGRENGKISLRRAQMKLALDGNAQMLIWLGRFYLNQREEINFTSSEPDVRALLEKWNVSATKKSDFEIRKQDKALDARTQLVA